MVFRATMMMMINFVCGLSEDSFIVFYIISEQWYFIGPGVPKQTVHTVKVQVHPFRSTSFLCLWCNALSVLVDSFTVARSK